MNCTPSTPSIQITIKSDGKISHVRQTWPTALENTKIPWLYNFCFCKIRNYPHHSPLKKISHFAFFFFFVFQETSSKTNPSYLYLRKHLRGTITIIVKGITWNYGISIFLNRNETMVFLTVIKYKPFYQKKKNQALALACIRYCAYLVDSITTFFKEQFPPSRDNEHTCESLFILSKKKNSHQVLAVAYKR